MECKFLNRQKNGILKWKLILPAVVALLFLVLLFLVPVFAADPTGAETLKGDPKAPADYVWILVCAFLVFLMQAGFAMLEGGFCRSKNTANLMLKNLMDFSMCSLVFMAIGFAFMFGVNITRHENYSCGAE